MMSVVMDFGNPFTKLLLCQIRTICQNGKERSLLPVQNNPS